MMRPLRAFWHGFVWFWDHSIGFVLTWILIFLIRGYQRVISPLLPPSCRYHPSCSAYGLDAMRTHGAVKGTVLTAWRLVRCNPWSKGGVDPIPERGYWLPDVHPNGEPRHGTIGPGSVSELRGEARGRDSDASGLESLGKA